MKSSLFLHFNIPFVVSERKAWVRVSYHKRDISQKKKPNVNIKAQQQKNIKETKH